MGRIKDEVMAILQGGARVEEGVTLEPDADIANLRLAVAELQQVVVKLADELDAVAET